MLLDLVVFDFRFGLVFFIVCLRDCFLFGVNVCLLMAFGFRASVEFLVGGGLFAVGVCFRWLLCGGVLVLF